MRVERREHRGLGAVGTIFRVTKRDRSDVLHLAGGPVKLRDFASAAAINNVRVKGIGGDVAIFDHANGMPVAGGEGAIVAAAGNADGAALLLAAADAIGESWSYRDVINLSGGLVVPGTPGGSVVDGDECALIADEKNNVWVVGIDPEILIVVAAGSTTEAEPGFAAVGGLHGYGTGAVDDIGILRIDSGNGKVAAADTARGAGIVGCLGPAFSCVVRTINGECTRGHAERGIKAARITGSDRNIDLR